jgi:predicted MFS family arabinose efflux permease
MAASESSIRYEGWRVAAASAAGVFFASLLVYGFSVLLKPLTAEFAWSRETTATAYACFALASALAAPIVGRLLDRYGPNRVAVPCIAICGLGVASMSLLTGSRVHLCGLFTISGIAATGTSPLAYSRAVSTWFDRRRGTALAIVLGGAAAASMAHPPALDALIQSIGWRRACLVMGAAVLAVGLPIVASVVRERGATARTAQPATPDATVATALRSWLFWVLIVVVAGSALAFNGIVVHIAAVLTDRGVSPARAALTLSLMGGAGLIGRLLTGWLLDRFRATFVSAALLTFAAGGILLLATSHAFALALVAAVMIGFGMGGELDVTPFLLSRYFGLHALSTLYGFAWTAMGAGAAAGSVMMGRAFDASGSYDRMLCHLAASTLVVAMLMLFLPSYRLQIDEQPVSADLRG